MGARLHCVDEGRGEAVVLVHAIGCDHRMWDSLAASLRPSLRVLRVDLRGHGASPAPAGEYSLDELAEDVKAVLDARGIERAHWVGLSLGGMIGQAFAIAWPQRLGRLVLANTTSSYGAEGPQLWQARAKAVREGGMAAIAEVVMGRYFSDAFREREPGIVERIRQRVLTTPPQGYIGCCAAIRDLDFTRDLVRIHARTLVIAGEKDAGTPPAMSEEIVRHIPGARLVVIAGAAHLSAVEMADEFNLLVRDFLVSP
ncbi:MAG TPA: 3-oxoadipate enol-lactonase [Usitatibacter sp.]|nr:3-oxoadipate enol-lactonase [Usitatibacter sp.]